MQKKEIDFKPTKKQFLAWKYLTDKTHTEIGYGGGAGGGKSWVGCFWQACMREAYPGTRGLMGRRELKNLKRTTLATFFKMADYYGWMINKHFTYKEQAGAIEWWNGSQILLIDLGHMPSDPLYLRLGGLELTDAFVDESNEVKNQAIEILKTRIGRQKNKEYGLIPKLFETFNPDKGHVYSRYYKPFKDKKLPKHRVFVPALPADNPHLPKEYIEQLKNADKITKERLLHGNFDYDDDPGVLMDHDTITDLFTNKAEKNTEKYLSGDVSRKGRDLMPVGYWEGLQLKKVRTIPDNIRASTKDSAEWIDNWAKELGVRRSHIVLDGDGVGGGVVDNLPGCIDFVNGSKAIKPVGSKKIPNYGNLKTQCYFKFSQLAKDGKVGIDDIGVANRELLIEELGQVKQRDVDKDGRIFLVGKEVVKENIGRSPDLSDMMMMRCVFELKRINLIKPFFI